MVDPFTRTQKPHCFRLPVHKTPQALEFRAQQRMWALEEDVRKAALASAVRDELAAAQLELQGKQRTKAREWEAGACTWRHGGSMLLPNLLHGSFVGPLWNSAWWWWCLQSGDPCFTGPRADEEARRIRLQAETARRTQLAMAAEEGAARHTVAREVLGLALQVEDEMAKVRGQGPELHLEVVAGVRAPNNSGTAAAYGLWGQVKEMGY